MLPGLDGTGILFEPALRTCPSEFQPVVQVLPSQEPLNYHELSKHVSALLPANENFILLGESFSGPLALELASRRPTGLLGVVLVATFVTPPAPKWISYLPWWLMFRFTPPGFIVRHYFVGRRGREEFAVLLRRVRQVVTPAVLASRVRLVLSVDARGALRACPCPILYLQAGRDRLVPERALAEILQVRPEVAHRRIDSPHLVFQVAPDEAWAHILSFARNLGGAF